MSGSSGTVVVSSGQTSSGLDIPGGGELEVLSGGTVSNTTMSAYSAGFISAGGIAINTTVDDQSTLSAHGTLISLTTTDANVYLLSGALATNVSNSGRNFILSNATIDGGVLSATEFVVSGASLLSGVTIEGNGVVADIGSGAILVNTTIEGDMLFAISGSTAINTFVTSHVLLNVYKGATLAGGIASDSTINAAGGTVTDFAVSGGRIDAQGSGTASDTSLEANAYAYVYSGGTTVSMTVGEGTEQYVLSTGVASDTTLSSGGYEVLSTGSAQSIGTKLLSGGFEIVSNATTATSTTVSGGGTLVVLSGGSVSGADLLSGGEVEFASLAYYGGGGTQDMVSVDPTTGLLTVTEGGTSQSIQISDPLPDQFYTTSDLGNDTLVTVACYVVGTAILTDRGDVPVEALEAGNRVVTAAGACRAIRWIGTRSYVGRFLTINPNVQPIRFRAGSLGDGLPRRDLLVSPEHAMFIGGLLIPARCLMNGSTITQERGLERVDYFHVELDSHDVILAEGAPSESFIDDDSRGMFHNATKFAALYPNTPRSDGFCAPRVEQGPELEAIRRRLAREMALAA